MTSEFFNRAYSINTQNDTDQLYDDWAAQYDQDVLDSGYQSPQRVVEAILAVGADISAQVLDYGCGTGIGGEVLKSAKFQNIVGCDISKKMVKIAKEKSVYNCVIHNSLQRPFVKLSSSYPIITAIGIFSPAHAPATLIQDLLNLLDRGGLLGFSMNDHALNDPSYEATINTLLRDKRVRILWSEYGDHLPKINLNSLVVVLQKL